MARRGCYDVVEVVAIGRMMKGTVRGGGPWQRERDLGGAATGLLHGGAWLLVLSFIVAEKEVLVLGFGF